MRKALITSVVLVVALGAPFLTGGVAHACDPHIGVCTTDGPPAAAPSGPGTKSCSPAVRKKIEKLKDKLAKNKERFSSIEDKMGTRYDQFHYGSVSRKEEEKLKMDNYHNRQTLIELNKENTLLSSEIESLSSGCSVQ